eukprot:5520684-Amphidinium_carterae.1
MIVHSPEPIPKDMGPGQTPAGKPQYSWPHVDLTRCSSGIDCAQSSTHTEGHGTWVNPSIVDPHVGFTRCSFGNDCAQS